MRCILYRQNLIKLKFVKLFLAADYANGSILRCALDHVSNMQKIVGRGRKKLPADAECILIGFAAQVTKRARRTAGARCFDRVGITRRTDDVLGNVAAVLNEAPDEISDLTVGSKRGCGRGVTLGIEGQVAIKGCAHTCAVCAAAHSDSAPQKFKANKLAHDVE